MCVCAYYIKFYIQLYARIRAIKILSVLNVRADAKTRTVPELTAGDFNGLGKPDKIRNDFLEFIRRAVGTSAGAKTVNGNRRDREYGMRKKNDFYAKKRVVKRWLSSKNVRIWR